MPRPRPLIFSGLEHDIHAHAVCWGLRENGIDPLWIKSWADPALPPLSLYCDSASGIAATGGPALEDIGSVWFRRPRNVSDFPRAHEADLPFLKNEWLRFTNNIHALALQTGPALWMNPPEAALSAENKLVQLHAAQRVGIAFPATLMSTDPRQIRRFVAEHGRVVYKPFQTHTWQDGQSGRMFSSYARLVDVDMLADDDSLRHCPGIYQQAVDKRHDLRVTIVGEHAFTARLDAPTEGDFIDWRVGSLSRTAQTSAAELPPAYLGKLQALMRELGIVFGCVDVAIDGDGTPHFLEINQAGQFLFLEQALPSLPLLQAVCALLAQGRTDYDLDALGSLRYADYLESDMHHEWWESVRGGIRKDGAIPGVSVE